MDVCVIGVPDDRAGERPKGWSSVFAQPPCPFLLTLSSVTAYVALTPGALGRVQKDPTEGLKIDKSLKEFVSSRKVDYKRLGSVEFIGSVPKTASGKLLRKDRQSPCQMPWCWR